MKKSDRCSLVMRFQPRRSSPLAEVVDWLNSIPNQDRREKLEEVCLILLLPYARKARLGKGSEEIEGCYWNSHNRAIQYLYVMQQTLGIKSVSSIDSILSMLTGKRESTQSVNYEIDVEEEEEEDDDFRTTNSLLGIEM
ncbi:MAG: hypothetical protein QNJ55_32700 [Xenococcus sp. MO_188.B8]|nr:hypothetical protein [Xenococcus sp. MO_188.B8]